MSRISLTKLIRRRLFYAALLVVTYLFLSPIDESTGGFINDKVAHIIIFFLLGVIGLNAFLRQSIVKISVLLFAYGL